MTRNPAWTRDELILALDLYMKGGRKQLEVQHPDVIALSALLNELPLHAHSERHEAFRSPNSVAMKLGNFLSIDPEYGGEGLRKGSRLEKDVWGDFAGNPIELRQVARAIRSSYALASTLSTVQEHAPGYEFREGRLLTELHKQRERNASAVRRKKEKVLTETGRLACEVCGFDFATAYGEHGYGFAECHHLVPLAQLAERRTTRLSDLAIVCANCHRMLHHGPALLEIEELRGLLQPGHPWI
jgi:5-methylcytosine-specific restriction enzyme A